MICVMTERRLRPGAWEAFRAAWEPGRFPDPLVRAFHVRDGDDPDHVVSFGFMDVDRRGLSALMSSPSVAGEQAARMDAIAPFVEWTGIDGMFEVIEELPGPAAAGG